MAMASFATRLSHGLQDFGGAHAFARHIGHGVGHETHEDRAANPGPN